MHGRDEMVATIESRLAEGGGVALHGPAGIGKGALALRLTEGAK